MVTKDLPMEINPERVVVKIARNRENRFDTLPFPSQADSLVCPDCQGTRAFWNPIEDAWCCFATECLNLWNSKNGSQDLHQCPKFRIPKGLESANMDSCDQSDLYKSFWLKWAKKPIGGILLQGPSGSGKTFASCAILNAYAQSRGNSAAFINISDLYLTWKELVKENREMNLILKYEELELLILDDIGQRTPTESFLEFLYILVEKRKCSGKGTIYTTNLGYQEMREKLGEALTSRISGSQIFKLLASDRRREEQNF